MENEEVSQDDFLKAFNINDESENANQESTDPEGAITETAEGVNPDPEETPANGEDSKNGETAENNNPEDQINKTEKTTQAFANMRVQLSQQNKLLEGVATVLGLDPKSKESMAQLQDKLTEALAKKQGIPTETLMRLNKLEEMEQQRNIEQVRNNAYAEFQKVKVKFGLDDAQLQAFANELVTDGKNPFTQMMDLTTEYKLRNFDKLLEQAKNQGAQAEIARATKATNNASTPAKKQGGVIAEPDKVDTVKGLTDWFNQRQSGK